MLINFRGKIKKNIWLTLVIVAHLSFSYYYFKGWWYSAIGTVFILLFSYFIWKKHFLKNVGLKPDKKTILFTALIAVFITICSYYFSEYIAIKQSIQIQLTYWPNYFHTVFYTFNEEIILGSLLLFYCIKKFKVHPLLISAAVAIIFSVVHFIFYKWIFLDTGIIQPLTLTTLFVVGFLRNNLIITFGHIGYSWALHFGWMAIMIGCNHFNTISGEKLTEPELFNTYLGSLAMLRINIILAGASVWLYLIKNKPI